jgi:hypothetical protein
LSLLPHFLFSARESGLSPRPGRVIKAAVNELGADGFNALLAAACQAAGARCCQAGRLFLPLEEFRQIEAWLAARPALELAEFRRRCVPGEGFLLYDQQQGCQFLDGRNLCRLQAVGLKPAECFWWPFHVYLNEQDRLEIRLATTCCAGHRHCQAGLPFVAQVEAQARRLGAGLFRRFRRAYPGKYQTVLVKLAEFEELVAPPRPSPDEGACLANPANPIPPVQAHDAEQSAVASLAAGG